MKKTSSNFKNSSFEELEIRSQTMKKSVQLVPEGILLVFAAVDACGDAGANADAN